MSTPERAAELLKLDLFEVLGVSRTANAEEIKKGYYAAVKAFHPDRAPSEEMRPAFAKAFARIELAKATLTDPTRRQRYVDEITRDPANDRSAAEAAFEFAKAEAYVKTNDRARAEQHIRKAVKLAPHNPDYAALLVSVQATVDATPARLVELVAELDRLITQSPTSERALLQRAQLRKRLGRIDEAMSDFTRVTELNPSNIEAARELRIHKMRAGTGEKAPATKPKPEAESSKGVGGIIKRLFGR